MSVLQKQRGPPSQCLTGCLYQVVQSTGLQGSNVLKLLPVLKAKDNPIPAAPSPLTPSRAPTLNVPPAVLSSPLPPPVSILARPSPVSVPLVQAPTLGNYIVAARSNLANTLHIENSFSLGPEAALFLESGQLALPAHSVSGNQTILMMNGKPLSPMKSAPLLPSGHSLQIPAHAEVISVPVSSLPLSIQQKILPQLGGTDGNKVPSVIYVSPVNTVKSSPQTAQVFPCPNSSSTTLRTKSSSQQRPPSGTNEALKGPMKWVVQESQESAACLVPVKSSNDTASKILQMMSKTKLEDVNLTSSDRPKIMQIKENALVMCNNKIFFLTKKGKELVDAGSKNVAAPPLPPQYSLPDKPAPPMEPIKDLSNRVVQVVLSKNKSPPPSAEESVQSNVVSTAKPKRKSFTPRAVRDDPNIIYIPDDDDCSPLPARPPNVPGGLPTLAASSANKGAAVKRNDQLQLKVEAVEKTPAKPPEAAMMDDRSWRLRFGLLKREKILLQRLAAPGTETLQTEPGPAASRQLDPVESPQHQWKRKSSCKQTESDSKKQKGDDPIPNAVNPEVSTSHPSTSSVFRCYPGPKERGLLKTSNRNSATWLPPYYGGEASYPPDNADFQVSHDIKAHFSELSLPSQRLPVDYMYVDETTKAEKIQRLKEVLKEREKALEALRCQKT